MKEIMYDTNSIAIAAILFVSMTTAIELGHRLGLRITSAVTESSKTQINAVQGSLLGILALLLGFTFSLSLQRFDSRSAAVVEEANAIGTAYLRAQLLPPSVSPAVQHLLREYLDLRIATAAVTLADQTDRASLLAQSNQVQNELWRLARQAAVADPGPVTTGLFIQSLNEVIDAYGRRDAALARHVPEVVLFVLYGTFLMSGIIVGYASGAAGHRTPFVTYIMVGLIVLLVFIIIDLDRPRRGLIQVDQQSMLDLRSALAMPPILEAPR